MDDELVWQRALSCVVCNVFQPANGKILACLHVICATCAADEVTREKNSIKCCLCSHVTVHSASAVPIAEELVPCVPKLYKASGETLSPRQRSDAGQKTIFPLKRRRSGESSEGEEEVEEDVGSEFDLDIAERDVKDMTKNVDEEMERIRTEASLASVVINDAFDRVEVALKEKHQQFLHRLDAIQWKQLEVHELKQQRLHRLNEKLSTLNRLVHALNIDQQREADNDELSLLVKNNISKVSSSIGTERLPQQRAQIKAVAQGSARMEMESNLHSLVLILGGPPVDLAACEVTPQKVAKIGDVCNVDIAFPTAAPGDVAGLIANVYSPFGNTETAALTHVRMDSSIGFKAAVSIHPAAVGKYTLTLENSASESLRIGLPSRPRDIYLNPQTCSSRITLSEGNLVAACNKEIHGATFSTVAAKHGYTEGIHQWIVKIYTLCGYRAYVGVTALPDGREDVTHDSYRASFFNDECRFGFSPDGHHVAKPPISLEYRCPFEDGDVLTITLQCGKFLSIENHRTGLRSTLSGIPQKKPLYPAICFAQEGQRIGFI